VGVGIKVFDKRDSMHKIERGLDGKIIFHGNDDYPHEPENRTQQEELIMAKAYDRARYTSQQ